MFNYSAGLGIIWGFTVFLWITAFIIFFETFALWKFFKKCGKNGWEAIIPIYNSWIKVEIAGLNWWWFLLLIFSVIIQLSGSDDYKVLIVIVPLFANFVCNYNLAKKFHQDTGFAILMTLFSGLMIPIMAFSKKYQYDSSVIVSKNGIFNDNCNNSSQDNDNSSYQNISYCIYCGTKLEKDDKFCPNCGKEK